MGNEQKDDDGYVSTGTHGLQTSTYALTTDNLDIDLDGAGWLLDNDRLGHVRVQRRRATTSRSSSASPQRVTCRTTSPRPRTPPSPTSRTGRSAPSTSPTATTAATSARRSRRPALWAASAHGTGSQAMTWKVRDGDWSVVVMNADGSAGVDAGVRAGADVPFLAPAGWITLGGGLVLLAGAGGLLYLGIASRPAPVGPRHRARAGRRGRLTLTRRRDEGPPYWRALVGSKAVAVSARLPSSRGLGCAGSCGRAPRRGVPQMPILSLSGYSMIPNSCVFKQARRGRFRRRRCRRGVRRPALPGSTRHRPLRAPFRPQESEASAFQRRRSTTPRRPNGSDTGKSPLRRELVDRHPGAGPAPSIGPSCADRARNPGGSLLVNARRTAKEVERFHRASSSAHRQEGRRFAFGEEEDCQGAASDGARLSPES